MCNLIKALINPLLKMNKKTVVLIFRTKSKDI